MSLGEAMLEIADQLEQEANVNHAVDLLSYVRQIRTAVKASAVTVSRGGGGPQFVYRTPEDQHRIMIEKAKEELRQAKGKLAVEEKGERMVEVVGQDELFSISSDMPVGARTLVGTQVYELREDGKLHFIERFNPASAPRFS